jgi:protein-L-isoaspartate(D-aspartate) O-methyltransferase
MPSDEPLRSGQPDEATRSALQRHRMVEDQLRSRGLTDERVLEAMGRVPREEFVPDHLRDSAYSDCALPIGYEQTISQPFTVAFMCEALQLTGDETVLEIGTGSGYAAAVLSHLAKFVHTVERIPELAEEAKERLARLGYENVDVHLSDGTLGLPEQAPFDGIVVTAAGAQLPQAYADQLADGGRIVIPLGPYRFGQTMYRFTLTDGRLEKEDLGGFAFVPLIGADGWAD